MEKKHYDDYDDYDYEEYYDDEPSGFESFLVALLLLPFTLFFWTINITFFGARIAPQSHVLGLYRDRLDSKYMYRYRD